MLIEVGSNGVRQPPFGYAQGDAHTSESMYAAPGSLHSPFANAAKNITMFEIGTVVQK